jgi:MFS family permease
MTDGTLRPSRHDALRSLRVRNYRLYFIGQLSSLCGTSMQTVAMAWLVLQLTDSGSQVGLVTSLQFIPILAVGGSAGVIIDRYDRRRLVLITEWILASQAVALALLVVAGAVSVWMLYVLALVQGFTTAFEQPARQTLLSDLVGDRDLPNALSLNAALFSLSKVVGPAVAAVVIGRFGVGTCFTVNAVSFAAIIGAVLAMRVADFHHRPVTPRSRGQLREGIRSVLGSSVLAPVFLSAGVAACSATVLSVVLPVLAKDTFDGGPGLFGVMSAMTAAGAFVVALRLSVAPAATNRRIAVLATGLAVSLAGCAWAPVVWLELVVLFAAGGCHIGLLVSSNGAIQLRSDPKVRGRAVALYFSMSAGAQGVGALVMGWITDRSGPRSAFAVGAAGAALTAVCWWSWLRLRPELRARRSGSIAATRATMSTGTRGV